MEDETYRVRPTSEQKKRLVEFMSEHPNLISCKVSLDFKYADAQRLWQTLAKELNSIVPGARKTWRQWKKTWHDLRSKSKKNLVTSNGKVPKYAQIYSSAEQEVLGIQSLPNNQENPEFIPLETDNDLNFSLDTNSNMSGSDPPSPPEPKVFVQPESSSNKKMKRRSHESSCSFNCDMLAMQEQKKVKLKEDYMNFKKDYLRKKLELIREQTEALKAIARELSDCRR